MFNRFWNKNLNLDRGTLKSWDLDLDFDVSDSLSIQNLNIQLFIN